MQHAEARLAAQRRPVALDVSPLLPLLNPTSCFNDTASVTEVLMHQLPDDTLFVADENVTAGHEYDMRTLFDEIEKSEIEGEPAEETMQTERGAKLLIDLSSEKTDKLLDDFDSKLIGQAPFKKALRKQVGAFRLFNSIGEQPIPSMLLLGPSDVGKTETARILSDLLAPSQPLPKINFGNYSSKDSLNSLSEARAATSAASSRTPAWTSCWRRSASEGPSPARATRTTTPSSSPPTRS